ncbi:unnamed protein product [Urochloa humidicola]
MESSPKLHRGCRSDSEHRQRNRNGIVWPPFNVLNWASYFVGTRLVLGWVESKQRRRQKRYREKEGSDGFAVDVETVPARDLLWSSCYLDTHSHCSIFVHVSKFRVHGHLVSDLSLFFVFSDWQ